MRIALLALLAACGNDTMLEPDSLDPTTEPVYYGQVDRILRDNCESCHSEDPDRLAPFSLVGLDAAVSAAEATRMAHVVMTRTMPPYYAKNDGSCQTFDDTKWLTDEEIDTLARWSNGEHRAGDPANATPTEVIPPKQLPAIDHTLDIGADFLPQGSEPDVYRCFVVDAPSASDVFLTGVHVRPGNATIVHHLIVFTLDSAATETRVLQDDAQDPGPGFACPGGGGDGTSFLTGWAPGAGVTIFPKDTGLPIPGGRKLLVQMHYNTANANGAPDRTKVDLDLAPSVAKRAGIISVRGNVNLPPRLEDAIAQGSRTLDIPVQSARVWGGAIHMHTLGTGAEVHVKRSTDTCMLDLDGWSFHWQHFYWYAQPFTVNRGERLEVTCHYDTTSKSTTTTWGEGTLEEMCLAYLYVSAQ